jgi:hypothetical protein
VVQRDGESLVSGSRFFGTRVSFVPKMVPPCSQQKLSMRAVMVPPQPQQRSLAFSGSVSPETEARSKQIQCAVDLTVQKS